MDVTCGVFWFFISVLKWGQKSCNHPVPGENNGYTVIVKKFQQIAIGRKTKHMR
jgi:hypothetical protein